MVAVSIKIVLVHLLVLFKGGVEASSAEKNLFQELFTNREYDVDVRPVKNDSEAVNVSMGLELFQIIQMKEKEQVIEISAWLTQIWFDNDLTWDPVQFNNITSVNVHKSKVWTPDIVLYNSVDQDNQFAGHLDKLESRIILEHTGRLKWLSNAVLTTHCDINVKYFPFDSQDCSWKFGSWTFDVSRLDIYPIKEEVDLENYLTNAEWHLSRTEAIRSVKKYPCCATAFPDVTYHMHISRRSLFYILNLVFPISVITMLTILAFLLPAESGERISLAVTLLLSVTVFMLIVADTTPATSKEIPLVATYFICSMISMVIMIVTLCYVNRLYHKQQSDGPMGYWTRRLILDKLSYIVGIRHDPVKATSEDEAATPIMKQQPEETISEYIGMKENQVAREGDNVDLCKFALCNIGSDSREIVRVIREADARLNKKMDVILEKIRLDFEDDNIKTDWRTVAMTIDRILFIFFFVNFALTLIGCFSLSPGYVR